MSEKQWIDDLVRNYYQDLHKNPIDWDLRRIFSDWLEEVSHDYLEYVYLAILANSQRWMIRSKKCPYLWPDPSDLVGMLKAYFRRSNGSLPVHLNYMIFEPFRAFLRLKSRSTRHILMFDSLYEAELALGNYLWSINCIVSL